MLSHVLYSIEIIFNGSFQLAFFMSRKLWVILTGLFIGAALSPPLPDAHSHALFPQRRRATYLSSSTSHVFPRSICSAPAEAHRQCNLYISKRTTSYEDNTKHRDSGPGNGNRFEILVSFHRGQVSGYLPACCTTGYSSALLLAFWEGRGPNLS